MATFGQGINAQFGAIDYSPIQRGSAVGAQLAAQGGQMIGQGLANLGQEVGKGVETYFKKQDMMKAQLGEIRAFAESDPAYLATLPPKFLEDAKAGNLKPREVTEVYAAGAMSRKIKNDVIQNNYITAQTNALDAKSNDEAKQRIDEANKRTAGQLVGNAYKNNATTLDLTGVDPAVAAIAVPEFTKHIGNVAAQKAFVENQDRIAGAPNKIFNSYLKPEFVYLDGKKLHRTYDANGVERYDEVTPSYQQKIDAQQTRLSTLMETAATSRDNNDLEGESKAKLQIISEYPSIAQTPTELDRRFKDFYEGRRLKNIKGNPPAGVTPPAASGVPLNATTITPNESVAPAAQAVQPAGVLSPEFSTAAALSAANDNPPAYRNGVLVSESTNPVGGSGVGVEQSALGASSVTPSPAVNQTVVAAPAPEQTANLQKGAARFVANATSTASTIANNANELYVAAEVGNAILNDPVLKADVKDKFGKLLSKVFSPKVRAMARLSPKTAKAVLSGATKVAKVSGQLVRPAMIVNSLDSIVGKYVGKSFPEQETTRATQAAASVLALWAETSTDNKKDEAMALLAQKSRYLMSSGMNREKKLAKNAEYLRLMNVLMERRTPRRGSLQNFNTGEIAQFDQSFSQ